MSARRPVPLRASLTVISEGDRPDHCSGSVQHLAQLSHTWHNGHMDGTLTLGKQGRLVMPAEVRAALGLAPGDRLHFHLAGRRLVLERQHDAASELRGLASSIPRNRSLVDELLAERRIAAASE